MIVVVFYYWKYIICKEESIYADILAGALPGNSGCLDDK